MKKKTRQLRDMQIKVYEDKRGRHRFQVFAGNGKQLARSSRSYDSVESLLLIIGWMTDEVRVPNVYKDKRKEYRWRCRCGEDTIVIISSESYKNREDANRAAWLVLSSTLA